MKNLTCIVVGGGFAGIHALKAIHKAHAELSNGGKLRLILLDKAPAHVRKVLLFRPAATGEPIHVPWERIVPEGTEVLQGAVTGIDKDHKSLRYQDRAGISHSLDYDVLVVSVGSIVRMPNPEQGGYALTGPNAAARIREQWMANLKLAATMADGAEKLRLMSAAVAGAGITGIETSAELAFAMRKEAAALRLDPHNIRVHLLNTQERLFMEGPAKVGHRLERYLQNLGIMLHHRTIAMSEEQGRLRLSDGDSLPVGFTVWTLGLAPNPIARSLGLPLTGDGRIIVDESYRVQGAPGVYSIGDCAHIVDPVTGEADRMTCKEAIPQATRLGRIIKADLSGQGANAERHRGVSQGYTVGLGPGHGLVWSRSWGIDIMITGKLAYKVKTFMWNHASMVR
ncbi:NAD(P)/FAD-dependent oxidoreductase [Paenibacillus lactis]|uniref:NAD(P)/FAD-dependent oxidoreductase n=1 Tax=Paenibacillus lactis TaxID=228574 RepID=UPI00369F0CCA